jgi:hypothetical protein
VFQPDIRPVTSATAATSTTSTTGSASHSAPAAKTTTASATKAAAPETATEASTAEVNSTAVVRVVVWIEVNIVIGEVAPIAPSISTEIETGNAFHLLDNRILVDRAVYGVSCAHHHRIGAICHQTNGYNYHRGSRRRTYPPHELLLRPRPTAPADLMRRPLALTPNENNSNDLVVAVNPSIRHIQDRIRGHSR